MGLKHYLSTILEDRFLAKTRKEKTDSEKVLESSQNMKGEIVRSMEFNSTISPFLGRWQNLTKSQKHTDHTHKTTIEIEKNICIHKQYMYMNYKDDKKYILVFSLFLSFKPERKEEERS